MKSLLHILTFFVFTLLVARGDQNYQSQLPYPSDPYSGRAQGSGNLGGYEGYKAPDANYSDPYSGTGRDSGGGRSGLLSWGSFQTSYNYNSFSEALDGGSGFGLDLNVRMMQIMFMHFGLDRLTSKDPSARSLEINTYTAGVGAYFPIGDRFQMFGEAGVRLDYASGNIAQFSSDDFGIYIRSGVRYAITDKVELAASVLFNNTDNLNNRVIELASYYSVLSWLDLGLGMDFGSDVNTFHLNGRWRLD
ncbi:MAG: outer membrane protein [Verrucomicrobiaceae bacterium]